jgi:TraB/PrgY/gumN family
MKSVAVVLSAFALLSAAPALAQNPAPTVETQATDRLDDIVVLARRSGAPMWTVTRGDSTLILVGAISGVPRDLSWRPDDLQAAAARADLVLTPQEGRASMTDLFRLIWRSRTVALLPGETTTADYLSADWQTRLDAVMAGERGEAWRRQSLLFLSIDLLRHKAGYSMRRDGPDAVDVVRRAARTARVTVRPIGIVRGDEIVESLIASPPSAHLPCLQSAILAAEAGPEAARDRAEDWRALRVADVVASPIDAALNQCWPWGDPDIAPQLRQHWAAAIETALVAPGVTLGVAPIRLLAETGGVLDGLEARGLEIQGPVWK